MNRVLLVGRVEGDPRFRITASGKRRLWFRLCCRSEHYDEAGRSREHTTWLNVVCWGGRAEGLRHALPEGQWVAVEGRISSWKREGEAKARWETEIVASEITRLEREPTGAGGAAAA